jgi:hypothetical protein
LATLTELTKSARQIPFKEVVHATTGFSVLDIQTNNPAHVELRKQLLKAAALAGERAAAKGLAASRPNEAGNYLEPFVRAALREVGLEARIPKTSSGEAQVAGYPDVEIAGPIPCYLELKTYNTSTANTTQRSFYYSPSSHPKITCDALHFLLGYEMEKVTRDNQTVFIPVRWKLLTLENLLVDLKFEFNQSNRGLYGSESEESVLAEGTLDKD